MEQVQAGQSIFRVITSWLKGHDWSRGSCRINEIKRSAEEAGEGIRESYPTCKCPGQGLSLYPTYIPTLKAAGLLFIRLCFHPSPQFNARPSFLRPMPWSRAPAFCIPPTGAKP